MEWTCRAQATFAQSKMTGKVAIMEQASSLKPRQASLETLAESCDLGIESLHPGGLELTLQLAELCHVERGSIVVDVASGTGEATCFLVEKFGCSVTGIDLSPRVLERARKKASHRGLSIEFRQGDAHDLPILENSADVVICECTMSALHKERALGEMRRVLRTGGYVGIHDLCWQEDTPAALKIELAELEKESKETLQGWKQCFEDAGFRHVTIHDRSYFLRPSMERISKQLGLGRRIKLSLTIIRRWGLRGLVRVLRSERLFRSAFLGYAIVVGRK
jgi:SAM-dependent methyltransferase